MNNEFLDIFFVMNQGGKCYWWGGEGELVTGGFAKIKNESLRLRFLDKKRKLLFRELSLAIF